MDLTRRDALKQAGLVAALSWAGTRAVVAKGNARDDVPSEKDLVAIWQSKVALIERLLSVIEKEIVPLTQEGVRMGNKLFGGAVLKKADLTTVVAVTNQETGSPLAHGEITAIEAFYKVPRANRPPSKDCIFLSTHEPCSLCLSGITWGGFNNFFYLFSYEDSKDAFNIPHDLRINQEVFRLKGGNYAKKNYYWSSWGLQDLIKSCDAKDRKSFQERVAKLRKTYDALSAVYQGHKNQGAEIPLP